MLAIAFNDNFFSSKPDSSLNEMRRKVAFKVSFRRAFNDKVSAKLSMLTCEALNYPGEGGIECT